MSSCAAELIWSFRTPSSRDDHRKTTVITHVGKDQQREGDCWLEDYQTLPPPDWDFDGGFGKYISISRPPSNLCGKVSLTLSKR